MKRIFAGILASIVIAAVFTGCDDVEKEKYLSYSKPDESSSQQEENDDNNAEDNADNTAYPETSDWSSLTFGMDSVFYTPEFNYKDLTDIGWSFDPSAYGLEDCTLTSELRLSCDVYLNREGVDVGVLAVGFANTGDEEAALDDCQIWAVKVDIRNKANYPQFAVPGNISWNASEDDIKGALGEPTESNRDDSQGCLEMIYNKDGKYLVHYYVYDDGGMMKFWIEKY